MSSIAEFLVEMLSQQGVRHIFGNPGTTEIPLVAACSSLGAPQYVVGLSELACVAMADAYARTSRSLAVVNLHAAPGLGNAIGGLYTAHEVGTPLLVIVGSQDQRHLHEHPILHGDLEAMVRPVTKHVFTIDNPQAASYRIRQAIRMALTPPSGPVALVCPMNVMSSDAPDVVQPITIPHFGDHHSGLGANSLVRSIDGLRRLALIVDETVYWQHAEREVAALADRLSAPIYVAPYTGILPVSARSAAYRGYLPPNRAKWAKLLSEFDGIVFLGDRGLRPTLVSSGELTQKLIWIGTNAARLGGDGEYEVAYVGDIGKILRGVTPLLKERKPEASNVFHRRIESGSLPESHPSSVIQTLVDAYPDAVWVDESGMSTTDVRALLKVDAGHYLSNGSGGIGWGVPAMVGASLSGQQVIGVVGDGAALYASEALWTAAKICKGRLFVLNNGRYSTLNEALQQLTGESPDFDAFSLETSTLSFQGIAAAYGWGYRRVEVGDPLKPVLQDIAQERGSILVDVMLDPNDRPVTADDHF